MNKCYECNPEAFGPYRYWMHKTLCEEHRRKGAEWLAKTIKLMARPVLVQSGRSLTMTDYSDFDLQEEPEHND